MTASNSNPFDDKAATWDANPTRQALTTAVAQHLQKTVPLQADWLALEYGCGTAALSVQLVGKLKKILALDASPGMIAETQKKLALAPTLAIEARTLDLTTDPLPCERFNLIFSAMALHHIQDTKKLFATWERLLLPGGWIAIADLCAEDGSFHEAQTVPHNGFNTVRLQALLQETLSPTECHLQVIYQIQKNNRVYEVFLLTAKR